jgi:hypothetical protein
VRQDLGVWDEVHPLYEAGEYEQAADRGRELLEAHPQDGRLLYNLACCEARVGRNEDAIEHLGTAIDLWDGFRDMASGDSDFDRIREEPAFAELVDR